MTTARLAIHIEDPSLGGVWRKDTTIVPRIGEHILMQGLYFVDENGDEDGFAPSTRCIVTGVYYMWPAPGSYDATHGEDRPLVDITVTPA